MSNREVRVKIESTFKRQTCVVLSCVFRQQCGKEVVEAGIEGVELGRFLTAGNGFVPCSLIRIRPHEQSNNLRSERRWWHVGVPERVLQHDANLLIASLFIQE